MMATQPISDGQTTVTINAPNQQCAWRVKTFFTKEPDTIEWINGFEPNAVFVDIGANIGLYSVWAAVKSKARVWAFEPEALNFAELNRNIALNQASVAPFPLAMSDKSVIAPLFLSGTTAGGSCHSFGAKVGPDLMPRGFAYKQGSMSARLDDLVSGGLLPQPDHIKVDVDGLEHRVFEGARRSMANAKSVLVEINSLLDEHLGIIAWMGEMGFATDGAQIMAARRTEGPFKGTGNVLFSRR